MKMNTYQLKLSERHYPGGVVVVTPVGELDMATAPELDDRLAHLTATGHHRLILNVAGLTFCDASGIRVLTRARARVDRHGGWLRLAAVDSHLYKTLAILALLTTLPVFDSVTRAIIAADPPHRTGPVASPLRARPTSDPDSRRPPRRGPPGGDGPGHRRAGRVRGLTIDRLNHHVTHVLLDQGRISSSTRGRPGTTAL